MAEATIGPPTFPLFSSLPSELRCQIWRDALPGLSDEIAPALYFWKKECWCPRRLTDSEEGYDPDHDEYNLLYEFRHDLLEATQLKVALLSVNFEAREIVLAWAREQDGVTIHTREGSHHPILAKPFDLARDVLYFTYDHWDECIREHFDRMFEPDLIERNLEMRVETRHLAVPEILLHYDPNIVSEIFQHFFRMEVLFVICGVQPDPQLVDGVAGTQQRWKIEKAQGGSFFWNHDRCDFDFGDGERVHIHETVYKLIEEAAEDIILELTMLNHMRPLEIRLASAIKV